MVQSRLHARTPKEHGADEYPERPEVPGQLLVPEAGQPAGAVEEDGAWYLLIGWCWWCVCEFGWVGEGS